MSVARLCTLLGVTRAGYYAWRQRPASSRLEQDRNLLAIMESIFNKSGGTNGSPRLQRSLAVQGHRISRRRVQRLTRVYRRMHSALEYHAPVDYERRAG
jgi:putative transposase